MSKMKTISRSLSVAALFAATPAMADVDAAALWAQWQAQSAEAGMTMTAEEVTETGTGLIISNLRTSSVQDEMTTETRIDQVTLTEIGATVGVGLSEVLVLTTRGTDSEGRINEANFEMRHDGLEILVSGEPGALNYAYSADRLELTNGAIGPVGGPPADVDMRITLAGLTATYLVAGETTEDRSFTSASTLDGISGLIEAADTEGGQGSFKMSFDMGPVTSTSSGTLSSMAAMSQVTGGTLPENLSLDGAATYESLSYEVAGISPEQSFSMNFSNGGGAMAVAFAPGGLTYDLSSETVAATIQSSEFPVPIEIAAASTGFLVTVPIAPENGPSDMALQLSYRDVTVNDAVWGMFDPMNALPRTPATLIVDLTGEVQMMANLLAMDPATMQGPPGELRSLRLNDLELSFAGASLEGSGDVTFEPGQVVPSPVGSIDLQLAGANALLDRLTQAGLLPMEQAAMVRGMVGMFARPGPTMDTLETTITFLPGGGLTANGIPLR